MPTTTRRTAPAALTAAVGLAVAGCASYTDIPGDVAVTEPQDVAMAFVDAVGDGDAQTACSHVSLEAIGADADECVETMQGVIDSGAGAQTESWTVSDVVEESSGDDLTSEAVIEDGSGQRVGSVFLAWVDGRWLITGL